MELTESERIEVADILRSRANEIASHADKVRATTCDAVCEAFSREIARLRRLQGKIRPIEKDEDDE